MRKFCVYISCILFAACGTENPEPDKNKSEKTIVTNNDSVTGINDTLVEVKIELQRLKNIPFRQKCDSFINAYLANYNLQKYEKRHILMRFENAWMKQVSLIKKFSISYGDTVVSPTANIGFYEYNDSTQRANAYSNWLACFGNDCNQIIPGEEIQIKSTPGFYIINEKEVITLDYPLEHEKNNWGEMKRNLRILFATQKSVLIEVAPHGKVRWINQ